MFLSQYQGEMVTNQERVMEALSKENLDIKTKIDSFKTRSTVKLNKLAQNLNLKGVNLELLLKSKNNQKEVQDVREHREKIDKVDVLLKANKEMEIKMEVLKKVMEEEAQERREI